MHKIFWKKGKKEEAEAPPPGTFVYECTVNRPGDQLLAPLSASHRPPWYTARFIFMGRDLQNKELLDFEEGGFAQFISFIEARKQSKNTRQYGFYDWQVKEAAKGFGLPFAFTKDKKRYSLNYLYGQISAVYLQHEDEEFKILLWKVTEKMSMCMLHNEEELKLWEGHLFGAQKSLRDNDLTEQEVAAAITKGKKK
ncbi:MAG: hypothetical protein Q9222_001972 [Ikaeria aurantiellina]